ncbi:MAG: PriCT-2 domain-containing protein [Aphanizomenon flos-aquae Clear-A1]|nr:PriCT-2 domain-containing protein [Aphanizomenon flos-aquae Clear-A1]
MALRVYLDSLTATLKEKYPGCILMHTRNNVDPSADKYAGKSPALCHKDTSNEVLWKKWSSVGIENCEKGLCMILKDSIIVFDVDDMAYCELFERHFPIILQTVIQKTKTGKHYFFRRTPECDTAKIYDKARCLKTSQGHILPVDIKTKCATGTGGVISIYPSPNKEWIKSPIDTEMLPMPFELVHFITELRDDRCLKQKKRPTKQCSEYHQDTNLTEIKELVSILNPSRSKNYTQWIELGWCLHNIDDEALLATWIEFSKQCAIKFCQHECEMLWDTMRSEGLGIGTLHMWAKEDNPNEYRNIINKRVYTNIIEGNPKHNAIAAIAYKILKGRFVCASATGKLWYEFDGNLWQEDKEAIHLRHELSTTVRQQYLQAMNKLASSLTIDDLESTGSTAQSKQKENKDLCSKILSIAFSLQDAHFKDGVVKEMREYFYDSDFLKKLDSKCNLIGFTNGVWDLDALSFRPAQPDDYISLNVGFPYDSVRCPDRKKRIEVYWEKLHPFKEQRDYVIKMFARQLYGDHGNELFHIHAGHQGAAGNGKSKWFDMLEKILGDYVRKFPVQVLTAKAREEAGKPAPEYQYWKGRRILYCTEPKDDDTLHSGIMKDLTGGEQIQYRLLFSNDVHTFRPQYKMHIMCNDPPKVDGSDEGVCRRIRKIDYMSRFVEASKVNEEQFYYLRDSSMFDDLKVDNKLRMEALRYILDAFDKSYDYSMPNTVAENSKLYLDENNQICKFIDDYIVVDKDAFFVLVDAKEQYKNMGKTQSMKRDLEKALGCKCVAQKKYKGKNLTNVFCGYRLKTGCSIFGSFDPLDY